MADQQGLLSRFFERLNSPGTQGLLAGSQAMMQPTAYPRKTMAGINAGMLAGSQGYNTALDRDAARVKALQDAEIEKMKMEQLRTGRMFDTTSEIKNWNFQQGLPEDQRGLFNQPRQAASPSNIQEWEMFQRMSPEQQAQFLEMKRALQVVNLGGTQAVLTPGGGIKQSYPVTPKPEEMPGFKGAQAGAVETAKAGVALGVDVGKKTKLADTLISQMGQAEALLSQGDATGISRRSRET